MPTYLDVADHLEITQLFARLARLLDDNRPADVHLVYTDDVQVHSPRTDLNGINEVKTFLQRSTVDGEHTQHHHSDILVTLADNQAEASATQLVHYYRPGHPPHRTSSLRLTYTATRTPTGWRFHKGHLTLTWSQTH